jgi:hypothetical protein
MCGSRVCLSDVHVCVCVCVCVCRCRRRRAQCALQSQLPGRWCRVASKVTGKKEGNRGGLAWQLPERKCPFLQRERARASPSRFMCVLPWPRGTWHFGSAGRAQQWPTAAAWAGNRPIRMFGPACGPAVVAWSC